MDHPHDHGHQTPTDQPVTGGEVENSSATPVKGAPAAADPRQPLENEEIHPGLSWISDPLGRKRIQARSESHAAAWVIDLEEDTALLWRVFTTKTVFTLEEESAEPFGRFPDHQEAARHALLADFQIFRRNAQARGNFASLANAHAFDEAAFGADARPFQLAASFIRARTKGLKKNTNGSWDLSLTIDGDLPRWLIDAPLGLDTMTGLLALGVTEDPQGAEARKRIEDTIRRAALRPQEPEFQLWLKDRYDTWGLIRAAIDKNSTAVEEAVRETIRRLCGVPSIADFRISLDAVRRFEAIDREFYFDLAAQKGIWVANRPQR